MNKTPTYEDFTEEEIEIIETLGGFNDIHKFWTDNEDHHLLVTCIANESDSPKDIVVCGCFPDGMPFMMNVTDFIDDWKAVTDGELYKVIQKEFQTYAKFFMEYVE